MSVKPINEKVLVKVHPLKDKTDSGIIVIHDANTERRVGTVLAVGRGKRSKDGSFYQADVKVGDRVHFYQYVGQEIGESFENLKILREEEIMAKEIDDE